MGTIYKISNKVNTFVYIGQTTWTMKKRWSSHLSKARMVEKSIKNGVPLDDIYKAYKNSILYNAMANVGIGNFKIETLEIVEDENDLNVAEKKHIAEHDCVHPNGYNSTTGGGSKYKHLQRSIDLMKQRKLENLEQNRHECLRGLPPKLTYDTQLDAIMLQKHPLCAFKGFYVRTYGTLEAATQAAVKFVEELEATGQNHVRERKLKNSPAKGVYEMPEGSGKYYSIKKVAGVTYRRAFSSADAEMNKQNAIEFAKDPAEYNKNNPKIK